MKTTLTFCLIFVMALGLSAQRPSASYNFTNGSLDDKSIYASHLQSLTDVLPVDDRAGNPDNAINLTNNGLYLQDITQLRMNGQISVAAWVKQNNTNAEWSAVINKWEENNGSYYLGINPATNTMRWNCFAGNIEDTSRMPFGEWVHYAATYDGLSIKLYRDGILANESEVEELYGESTVEFRIGAQSNNPLENAYFDGDIDEVRVYDVALTAVEVGDLYNDDLNSAGPDLVLYDLNLGGAQLAPGKLTVNGTIANISDVEVSDMEIQIDAGGQTAVLPLTLQGIPPHEKVAFSIGTDIPIEVGTELDVVATILADNDIDLANNSRQESTRGYAFLPERKVVIEEGTGTWCPWCPRGAVAMDQLTEKYPDQFIGIAVHNADVMTDDNYNDFAAFTGFPSCHVDRTLMNVPISPNAAESYMQSRLSTTNISPAAISHTTTYFPFTRQLFVTATVEPATPLSGFFAQSLIITEDGISGTTSEYDQFNNYAFNQNGPMGGYETLANPVPASEMVYDHVAREIVGGNVASFQKLAIYPNPTSGEAYIELELKETADITLSIRNTNGQLISLEKLENQSGFTRQLLATENCVPGIYLVGVSIEGQTTTKKIIINK